MRSGVIAQKVGMTRVFTEAGEHVPVTVLRLGKCQVVGHRTKEKNGYVALQLGSGTPQGQERLQGRARPFRHRQGRAEAQAGRVPRRATTALIPVGAEITADHFVVGQFVDVTGTSIGKGFAGAHEALEFRRPARHARRVGLAPLASARPATARTPARPSRTRRWPATWASSASPRSISRWCRPTSTRGLILVEGAVPGAKGGWITVRDAVKKTLPKDAPKPGKFRLPDGDGGGCAGRRSRSQRGGVRWN